MKSQWMGALVLSQLLAAAAMAQNFGSPSMMPVPYTGFPSYPSANRHAGSGPAGYGGGYAATHAAAVSQPLVPALPGDNGVVANGHTGVANGHTGVVNGDTGAAGDCGDFGDCGCHPRWYLSTAALFLQRDRGNNVPLTYDDVDLNNVLIYTEPTGSYEWDWGWEVTLGRTLGENCRIEATYWGVSNMEYSDLFLASTQASGAPNTFLNFGGLLFDDGAAVAPLFDTAAGAHLMTRTSSFHNVELNLLSAICGSAACGHFGCGHGDCGDGCGDCCAPCRSWCCTWLFGVRYFQFHDDLLFATSSDNEDFVFDANEAYYDVDIVNHLIGAQIGARLDWNVWNGNLSLWAMPRIGVYNNHVEQYTFLRSFGRQAFDLRSSKDDAAVLGQLDMGVDWHLTDCFKIYGGYRVLGAAGVALPEEQIPMNMTMTAEMADVDSTGHVILHGAFVGAEVSW